MAKPVWIWWLPCDPEHDLHGFLTIRDRDEYERGNPGPFRRIVRNHHKLGPEPDDVLAVRAVTDKWNNRREKT